MAHLPWLSAKLKQDLKDRHLWLSRLLIGLVLGWNLECAVAFLSRPTAYLIAFGLSGLSGETALRGIGILFLMWNVPYLAAFLHPRQHHLSLYEAIVMQSLGLIGETALLFTLPAGEVSLHTSITRFILFDGAGLFLLLLAGAIILTFPANPTSH